MSEKENEDLQKPMENQDNMDKGKKKQFLKCLNQRAQTLINNRVFNKILVFFILCPLIWLLVYLVVGKSALPGEGIYFSLIAMVTAAHVVGYIFEIIKMLSIN